MTPTKCKLSRTYLSSLLNQYQPTSRKMVLKMLTRQLRKAPNDNRVIQTPPSSPYERRVLRIQQRHLFLSQVLEVDIVQTSVHMAYPRAIARHFGRYEELGRHFGGEGGGGGGWA